MSHRAAVHDLKSLILSFHSLIAIETVEEERVRALIGEVAADLTLPLYEWSLTSGFNRVHGRTIEATQDPQAVLKHIGEIADIDAIYLLKDLSTHLTNPNVSRGLRELAQRLTSRRSAIVLTGDPLELPKELEGVAVRFTMELPDEAELRSVIRAVIDQMSMRQRVQVDLSRDDAQRLVRALSGLTINQARQVIAQAIVSDGRLSADDIQTIIRCKGELIERGGILEFFAVEENTFELGGFARLKGWLGDARIGFTPEAKALNLEPPKGVMIVGVQGCGKSLAAKFIAREWQLPLLKLDAGRLYEKYVGESEKNFRRATTTAEAMAPVILWIDEIEKAFAQASSADADGGLSQRLFGAFLTWLQEKKEGVFVVGAANDLTRVPPELLRKGRFDEIFFVDLPSRDERMNIFTIHLRLRKQDPQHFDLHRLTDATDGFSGAEIEQAVISSMYRALQRRVPPSTETILEAVGSTVPLSVSRREDIERVRTIARGRFTPVS
ncbi:MAG TPA: AAA family ATPase [Thermoanaerobaculia bacterium]|nr:AAA family ATPase [Thermoanaerobaculia bacterium]